MDVVVAPNFAGWDLAGAEVAVVRMTRIKVGSVVVVVFSNVDGTIHINTLNPEDVAPIAAVGLTNCAFGRSMVDTIAEVSSDVIP